MLLRAGCNLVKNLFQKPHAELPGLLAHAMYVDLRLNGHDLLSDNFYITLLPETTDKFSIVKRPRIGVDYARSTGPACLLATTSKITPSSPANKWSAGL